MSSNTNNDIATPLPSTSTQGNKNSHSVIILVDPYSTGCCIAQDMKRRGYGVLCLWTVGFSSEMKLHVPTSCAGLTYTAEVQEINRDDLEGTADLCRAALLAASSSSSSSNATASTTNPPQIVACLAGGEAGVDLADALSDHLQLRSNGIAIDRCDKKVQQELIQAAGLRSVRQAGGTTWSDVEPFLQAEPFPVVLKPTASAGSDGVKLCRDMADAKQHFDLLMASQMVNGGDCPAVLCQEFLQGKEYVVDHVSRDGVHKTCMVWVYDKRPANGSQFVYFGCLPVDTNSPEAKLVIPYVRGVLDALGLKDGPSHGEVMLTKDGPCLVEMNCRARGGDGNWRSLAKALTGGYTQVDVTVDAYLEPAQFDVLPSKPPSPFCAVGQEVCLVSYGKGTVEATPGFEIVKKLASFSVLESGVRVGSTVEYTVDLVTCIGSIILMHSDPAVLERDIQFIRHLEEMNGFFTFAPEPENLGRSFGLAPSMVRRMSSDRPELRSFGTMRRAMTTVDASKELVVLVDPYSTGCCVAQDMQKRGYRIMALWTAGFAPAMKTHVPLSCEGLTYTHEMDEGVGKSLAETAAMVKEAAGSLRIVAVLAGGEAGVDLADALSEYLKVRTNGTEIANRRDKKIQQELVKAAGYRSVRQSAGTKFGQVEHFLRTETFPVVLKPTESAGSDGVKLCHNFDEAKSHFDVLMKSQMVNGGECPAVLCQEFLRGKEYVVDHVSRDGIHKTCMVWVYDKRPANGSQFVYFGCLPVDPQSPEGRLVIPYVRGVLDALGLVNGPSHGEVMMTPDGPCLVEMNCRARGGDGNWSVLARGLTGGYSQVESTVDSYLEKQSFAKLPDKPPSPFKASGQEVCLVCYSRGTVKATPGFDIIQQLPSFVYLESGVKVGSQVEHTIDLVTCIGSVILMHHDPAVTEADVQTIRQLEKDNALFEYEVALSLHKSFDKMSLTATDGNDVPNSPRRHTRTISISEAF